MTKRLPNAGAAAAVAFAAAVIFGPALFRREVFTARDHSDYFQPMRAFTAGQLRAGRLPLWNPYSASGEPWLANPQTGVFYPPAWLFLILPFATAYVLYLALHAVILGSGTYLLLAHAHRAGVGEPRIAHHSPSAAAVAAVAVMMSGPVLSLLDVSNNFTTFAWIPMILWRAVRDRDGDASPRVAVLLLSMSFLAGEPFFAGVAAVAWAAIVRRPRIIAIVAAGSAALVAVQAIPFMEMIAGSDRMGGFTASEILRDSFRPAEYARLVLPPRIGLRVLHYNEQFIAVAYVGIVVILVAFAGIVAMLRSGRKREAGMLGAVIAATLFIAAGPSWIAQLPLTLFRYPARVLPFAVLALAPLVAAGHDLLRSHVNARVALAADVILILAVVADLGSAVRPLLRSAAPGLNTIPYSAQIGRDGKILRVEPPGFTRAASRTEWIAGYLNLPQRRFDSSTAAPAVSRAYSRLYARAQSELAVARAIGIAYVLSERPLRAPFMAVERSEHVFVSRFAGALPLAYVRTAAALQGTRFLSVEPSQVNVGVATVSGGMLVLTQNDAEGWSVSIDGKIARGTTVFGALRAVQVPAGEHNVTWVYRPLSLKIGAVITIIALLWMIGGVRSAARISHARG